MLQTTFPATLRAHRFFIPLQLLLNGPEHTQKVLYQFQVHVFSFLKVIKLKAFFHFIFCIRKSNILDFHNIALYTIPICAYYIYMYFTFIYLYFNYVKSLHLLYTVYLITYQRVVSYFVLHTYLCCTVNFTFNCILLCNTVQSMYIRIFIHSFGKLFCIPSFYSNL